MKSIIKKKPSTDEQNINKYDAMIQDLSADDLSLVTGGVDLTVQTGGIVGAAGKAEKVACSKMSRKIYCQMTVRLI